MDWLIFHIASGQSYFTGLALVAAASALGASKKRAAHRAAAMCGALGLIAIAISSTPAPYWLAAAAVVAIGASLATARDEKRRKWAWLPVVAVSVAAAALEGRYLFSSSLQPAPARSLTIIGDSLTAGMGDPDRSETWPKILGRKHRLAVQDLSRAGDTAGAASRRLGEVAIRSPVVIVEIGGNDVLGPTSVAQFERDLDALLQAIVAPGRQIVMLELPLPPFFHGFGYVQRKLAKKHGVHLAPKRLLMSVLARTDATVDSIHLSQAGHEQMAAIAWELLGEAFASEDGAAVR